MAPFPVTFTTRIMTYFVGDHYKPSFATGPHTPNYALGFACSMLGKRKNLLPNGCVMVIYHGRIRKKPPTKPIQTHISTVVMIFVANSRSYPHIPFATITRKGATHLLKQPTSLNPSHLPSLDLLLRNPRVFARSTMPGNVASVTIGSPGREGGGRNVGVSGGGRCFTLFFLGA